MDIESVSCILYFAQHETRSDGTKKFKGICALWKQQEVILENWSLQLQKPKYNMSCLKI